MYVKLLAPIWERIARTGPLMFATNAPEYGEDITTSS